MPANPPICLPCPFKARRAAPRNPLTRPSIHSCMRACMRLSICLSVYPSICLSVPCGIGIISSHLSAPDQLSSARALFSARLLTYLRGAVDQLTNERTYVDFSIPFHAFLPVHTSTDGSIMMVDGWMDESSEIPYHPTRVRTPYPTLPYRATAAPSRPMN